MEHLLRGCWSTKLYLQGSASIDTSKKAKPFLLEDSAKGHIDRIGALMKDDYDWACIGMVAILAAQSEVVGSWAEACPCHSPW